MFLFLALYLILYCAVPALCQKSLTSRNIQVAPFIPFSLPIAIRNPYFNGWLPQGSNARPLGGTWMTYWSNAISAWFIAIIVDGHGYELSGFDKTEASFNGSASNVNQNSVNFTATSTTFNMQAGPMTVHLTFLSPIEPKDLVRQSLPFSYLSITAESNDGKNHNVRLYSDVTGEWLMASDSPGRNFSWSHNDDGTNIILSQNFTQPVPFTQIGDHAIDATEYLGFRKIDGTNVSWQISEATPQRNSSANTTSPLSDTADPDEKLLSYNNPVMGIEVDWGEIQQTPTPAVFALGVVRDPVIQYKLPNGSIQMRSHYYRSASGFETDAGAINSFLSDFERAQQAAATFDSDLRSNGVTISNFYAQLLTFTARQIMGSIDITIARGSDGNWNFSDTLVFMKNMGAAGSDSPTSSDSWTQSINTVDTLFTAFPAFLYLNPEIAGYLLTPLLNYQDSSAYTLPYAAKNIGSTYPNATADAINTSHAYQIEETANMIIMVLAYSQISGNNTLIHDHYGLLRDWGQYLANNTLEPSNQLWADYVILQNSPPQSNQTNLALKGIIALSAMSKIASIAGNDSDSSQFNSTAVSYIQFWKENAFTGSEVNYFYGDTTNNGPLYNLYADVLLDLDFVPDDVYTTVNAYYTNLTTNSGAKYGFPLMSEVPGLTSVSAMMLSAATVTNQDVQNEMISQVHHYATSGLNNTPLGGYYDPAQGSIIDHGSVGYNGNGVNSPTIGGVFALLAKGNNTAKALGSQGKSKSKDRSIAGGVVGGIVALILVGVGIFFFRRHRRNRWSEGTPDAIALTNTRDVVEPFHYDSTNGANNSQSAGLLMSKANGKGHRGKEGYRRGYIPTSDSSTSDNSDPFHAASTGSTTDQQQTGSSGAALLERTDAGGDALLRDEMEALRREVERIRQRDTENISEAPPSYAEDI